MEYAAPVITESKDLLNALYFGTKKWITHKNIHTCRYDVASFEKCDLSKSL